MTPHPGREEPDRPLEGIGAFAWKLSLATVIAIAGVTGFLVVGGVRDEVAHPAVPPPPSAVPPSPAPVAVPGSPAPVRVEQASPRARLVAESLHERAASAVGRDVDRRYADGELSEAQRRFEPCRGGDLRRLAWIDARQRVRKLVQVRASGLVLEQWFDDGGRLREAVVRTTAAGRDWRRRVTVDEAGKAAAVDTPSGVVPDEPPPELVRGDPSSAFFAGPGCGN